MSGWQSRQQMAQNYTKVLRHLKKEYATRLGPNAVQLMMVCGSDTLEALTCPNSQIDEQLMLSNFEVVKLYLINILCWCLAGRTCFQLWTYCFDSTKHNSV